MLRDTLPHDQYIFIDTLKEIAIRNYAVNPDTAELLLDRATLACDSIGLPEKKFQILLEKVEFYQYRKPDFLKSVQNLSRAVTIFIRHPGPYAEDPYIYLNIGNFFYRIHCYEKARTFYNLSAVIAGKIKLYHAEVIAQQNIGLTFQQLNQHDSALIYFTKIWHQNKDVGFLTRALNFYYLSGQYLRKNELKAVSGVVDSGFAMVNNFKNQKPSDLGAVYPKLLVYCQEIESNLQYSLYQYYCQKHEYDKALVHFEKALTYARNIQSNGLLSNLLLVKVCNPSTFQHDLPGEILADSVVYYTKLINDPFKFQQVADTMARHFSQAGNSRAFAKYNAMSLKMADSLDKLRSSNELFESEILISSVAAERIIQKLNFEKAESQRSLKYHKMIALFFLIIAILTTIAFYIIIKQNQRLNLAYGNLTDRIRESVNNESIVKPQNTPQVNEAFADIIHNMEQLMQQDKGYLNPGLTLNELAALLQTNKTYLSSILNQQFGMNFNDYVNQFRVKEACRLIMDPDFSGSSIDHILEKAGFNTKSTFYSAFKKFTGMSPATFYKKVRMSPVEVLSRA